jgi:polyprenyl-phospho-N-acetylgalactosaminyl synthase
LPVVTVIFIFIPCMSQLPDPKKIFVVVPSFNEETVIESVITDITGYGYSLVIVDDGSKTLLTDKIKNQPLYLLRHRVNLGQGAALQTGIEFALARGAEYIISFDADGQHQASDIKTLVNALAEHDADIASGSRFLSKDNNGIPKGRKRTLQLARYFNFFFTGLMLTDAHNGLRAMNREAAEKLKLKQNGMAHATEILSLIKKNKWKHVEVPVSIRYTDYSKKKGQSVWSGFRIFFELLLDKIFK